MQPRDSMAILVVGALAYVWILSTLQFLLMRRLDRAARAHLKHLAAILPPPPDKPLPRGVVSIDRKPPTGQQYWAAPYDCTCKRVENSR